MAGGQALTSPPTEDLYAILQVAPRARIEVITAAFTVLREAACQDESAEGGRVLVRLMRAYAVLGDAERRRAYDAERAPEMPGRQPPEGSRTA